MNKSYRLIWNSVKDAWVVVAETVTNKGSFPSLVVGSIALMAAVLCGALPAAALDPAALPTGGQIVSGAGSIATNGSAMTVTQGSQRMIANWSTFNIGQNASVAFQQPNALAIALNRIQDQNPSQIFGSLSANGQVWLLNSSGIMFGSTARVDVGGLVASSLNISNENFLAGKYFFENTGAAGMVINQGSIRTANGGYVAFLSPKVVNEGSITTPNGTVALAAGDKVSLDFTGDKLVTFTIDQGAIAALAENKGLIKADGGLVMMTAKAANDLTTAVVNNSGIIEAQTIENRDGRIILDAEGGMTTVTGTLDASSTDSQGGRIIATGDRVWIKNGAHLTASGKTGGGEVLVGGSWQNSDTTVRQSIGTVIEENAKLEANATDTGDGGMVVAWSDITNQLSVTRAYGTFEAKGGANGGNGGRIETSGHWLDVAGSQGGASAAHGLAGIWLFDPYNVTIAGANANGSWGSAGGTDTWTPSGTSTILNTNINSKLEGGTSVTVTTNGGGAEIGDITVSSAITKTGGDTDVTLTLKAANSIVVDQAISNTGGAGKLNVVLDADNNNGTGDGAGIVLLNANITTNGGSLSFGTGRFATIGGVSTLVGGDVFVGGSAAQTLSTSGGTVDVKGEMIIANTNGLTINSNGGNVRFYGLLNSGNSYSFVQNWNSGANGVWTDALTNAKIGTGNSVGDTYLATITSRLENAIAGRTANYTESWLGARRVIGIGTDSYWRWVAGPEGLEDSGKGRVFFQQNASGGGTTVNGGYSNWASGEPNNWGGSGPAALNLAKETALQFTGNIGQWNDLSANSSEFENKNLPYVKETNLLASPLTIDAGTGTVTFSGAVGTSKALASLNVTSTGGIAINGGAVTTEGVQTYNGNVTLGAAATTLTQTNANTDFTIQTGKTITNAHDADASLTIKTTGSILMNSGSSISSSTGKLNTILWSDSDNSGSGYIFIHDGNTIDTHGGRLVMAGGLDDGANGGTAADGTPDGYAFSATNGYSGVGIGRPQTNVATAATTITTGGGDIIMRGKSTAADPSMGIHFAHSGTLNAGTGTLTMLGEATNYNAIELSAWEKGMLNISAGTIDISGKAGVYNGLQTSGGTTANYTTLTAGAGGIRLYGENTANTTEGLLIGANLTTTGGGSILIESPDTFKFYGAHSYSAASGNITIRANSVTHSDTGTTFAATGALIIEPYTTGHAINIGTTGAGTLDLASSYFSTNFTDGFSNIIVGNASAGNITLAGNTTYNDPLTFKTAGNITSGSAFTLTGGASETAHLTLWSDADNNADGHILIHDGSALDTNGGNLVMAGGADTNSDGRPDGFATSVTSGISGVGIGRNSSSATSTTAIRSDGGNIVIKGKSTGGGTGMGINFSNGGTLNAGTGTLTMTGESSSYAGIELSAWLDSGGASYLDINAGTVDIRGTSSSAVKHGLASSQLNNEYTRITAGSGGLYLYGHNTANTANGVEISLNATTTGGGSITVESPNYVAIYGGANAHSFNAGAGNTTVKTNALSIGANHTLSGTGTLTIEPYTAARAINIGTTGAGTLDIASSYFSTNFTNGFSGITIGNATAGAITVAGATTFNDSTTLQSNSTIAINGAITANENLILLSNGAITQSAAVGVTGTTSITAGANNITLTTATNNFGGAVSVVSGKDISIIDSNAMSLGAITSTGLVDIATLTGDLTLTGAVQTSNATADAIKLNAGKSAAAGTAAGGDITVSGGSINLTGGGAARATLFTGNVTNANLTTLVVSGSSKFRYNADETTDFSAGGWTNLGAGAYAVYREQPTVTTTSSNDTKVYNGVAYTGGNGVTYGGFTNGDTSAALGGTLAYGGTSQGAINAGTYAITPSGYTNGLGYALTYTNGSLTVTPAALSVTASDATKTYGQTPTLSAFTSSGLQNGETIGSVTLASAGVAGTASVADSPYAITGSNATGGTFAAGNYTITYTNGSLTVTPAALSVTASDATKTYGQTPTLSAFTSSGLQNGETIGSVALASAGVAGTASVAGSPYAITASNATGGTFAAGNYTISYANGSLTVNPAALTVTADNASKTYGQTTTFSGSEFSASGLQNGETVGSVTLASAGAASTASVAGSPYAITASNATGGTFAAGNYTISYANGSLTVNPAALTVTADNASKTYGQTTTFSGSEFSASGLQNGETVGSVTLASAGAASTASVAGNPYAITASNATGGTFNAGNYTISYINGQLTVNAAPTPTPTNTTPESVASSLTSIQNAVNGTQQDQSGTSGAPVAAPTMGPGAGSTTLASLATSQLISQAFQAGGATTLASSSGSTPITFSTGGATTTINTGPGSVGEPLNELATLPLFQQTDNAAPVVQGGFVLREGATSLSVTITSASASPPLPEMQAPQLLAFTLLRADGTFVNLSTGITSDGFLVISMPSSVGSIDQSQALLMAITVLKRELKMDLKKMKGVVLVK